MEVLQTTALPLRHLATLSSICFWYVLSHAWRFYKPQVKQAPSVFYLLRHLAEPLDYHQFSETQNVRGILFLLLLNLVCNLVDVLTVTLSIINLKGDIGNEFEAAMLLYILP